MEEIVLFVLSFIFILLIYEVFIVRRAKDRVSKKGKKKKKKEPTEVSYLVRRYHLDLDKINYSHLLQVISFVSSFDIALIVTVIAWIDNYVLAIIVGFCFTLIIILVSYHLVYLFYKKKGMIKNES